MSSHCAMRKRLYLALFLILLSPWVALADGVDPILNLFHRETWLPATGVALVIILVETDASGRPAEANCLSMACRRPDNSRWIFRPTTIAPQPPSVPRSTQNSV
jgi:hypothetical protein